MQTYKNLGGNTNIACFSIGEDYIDVQFQDGSVYRYSYQSAGSYKIEKMKELAMRGYGLNSYIMRQVRYNYEK